MLKIASFLSLLIITPLAVFAQTDVTKTFELVPYTDSQRLQVEEFAKDFFIFEASNENAKLYFRQFFKDAVIIEPIELREELKKELEDLLNEYRK